MTDLWTPDINADELEALLAQMTEAELAEVDSLLTALTLPEPVVLQPHQVPPPGMWRLWLLMAGRGAGKTQACAFYMNEHAMGPPCQPSIPGGHRMAIIAPTLGDAMDACIKGPSGLKALNPDITTHGGIEGTHAVWPNGAEARLFGVNTPNDVERLRAGGNRCLAWLEELAAWRHLGAALAHMRFGLRIGPHPRAIGSTTPKNRPEIKALQAESDQGINDTVVSTGTTYDNPHLDEGVKAALEARYKDTKLGRQELLGELLSDIGEVFKGSWFDKVIAKTIAPAELRGTGWKRVRYWDMAATEAPETTDPIERVRLAEEGNDPDWTAGALVAWNQEQRILVIEDVVHVRRGPAETEAKVVQTVGTDGTGVKQRMEQEPGASGKTVVANYKRLLAGFAFEGQLPSGDKVTRAEAWAGLAEQGRVVLVAGEWNNAFVDECEEFTRDDSHSHDDMIDAVSGAFTFFMGPAARRGGLRYR